MVKDWTEMTPEEKKEQRFRWWLDTEGIDFISIEAKKAYIEKLQRLIDVYQVKEPDRVPVTLPPGHFAAYIDGADFHTVMYDYDRLIRAWERYLDEFEMDTLPSPGMVMPGKVLDMLDYRQMTWPGHGLPLNAPEIQFVEAEYAGPEMYDALLRDPSDFWLRYYMPKIAGIYEPFAQLPPLTSVGITPTSTLGPLLRPEVQSSLQTFLDIAREYSRYIEIVAEFNRRGIAAGYPMPRGGGCLAPFDTIGDLFRGSKGVMLDMYQRPDKLLEAMDKLADITTVMFTLHKGDDTFMSLKQFESFYWPSLKKVIDALIAEGIIPILFAEGSYNTRLETVNEFARGQVAWRFDQTDMANAKKILGSNCCIAGNVPSSLLYLGTPEAVKDYCRNLIEVCGPGGGYILACGASADNINPENIRAMIYAAKEYGVYRR
jgi:hypothetical protein